MKEGIDYLRGHQEKQDDMCAWLISLNGVQKNHDQHYC